MGLVYRFFLFFKTQSVCLSKSRGGSPPAAPRTYPSSRRRGPGKHRAERERGRGGSRGPPAPPGEPGRSRRRSRSRLGGRAAPTPPRGAVKGSPARQSGRAPRGLRYGGGFTSKVRTRCCSALLSPPREPPDGPSALLRAPRCACGKRCPRRA